MSLSTTFEHPRNARDAIPGKPKGLTAFRKLLAKTSAALHRSSAVDDIEMSSSAEENAHAVLEEEPDALCTSTQGNLEAQTFARESDVVGRKHEAQHLLGRYQYAAFTLTLVVVHLVLARYTASGNSANITPVVVVPIQTVGLKPEVSTSISDEIVYE